MNKIFILALVGLLLVGCAGLYYFNQPQMSVVIETIKPQIICYGGGC